MIIVIKVVDLRLLLGEPEMIQKRKEKESEILCYNYRQWVYFISEFNDV